MLPYWFSAMTMKAVGKAAMEEWLAGVPAEWGSASQGDLIEHYAMNFGNMSGGGCAEVFESLGRYDEAITAAQADIRNYDIQPLLLAQSYAAVGRCQAKLGRAAEAAAAFEAGIAEAHRCDLHYLEMLARRDFIVHVLDAEGRRDQPHGAGAGRVHGDPGFGHRRGGGGGGA